jgi:hypothetical protein
MYKRGNKKAQLALFVIIAVVIIAVILIIFLLPEYRFRAINPLEEPQGYIRQCLEEDIQENLDSIFTDPRFLQPDETIEYKNKNISYLCYTQENNSLCVNYPGLLDSIRQELYDSLEQSVEDCFLALQEDLKNYNYKQEETEFDISILPNEIFIDIEKEISFDNKGQIQTFQAFDVSKESSIYEIMMITNEIQNQEVDCDCETEICNADIFEINGDNLNYQIKREIFGDRKIYTITSLITEEEFAFAIRNCVKTL